MSPALKGGSSWVKRQPAFSCDAKFLLVCTGRTVTVLVVSNGERVAELTGHTDFVTGVVVVKVPQATQVPLTRAWTCSLDGTIRLWNFLSGLQIKCFNVQHKIMSMVVPGLLSLSNDELIAYLTMEQVTGTFQITRYNLSKASGYEGSLLTTTQPRTLVTNHSGSYVGVADDRAVVVWKVSATNAAEFAGAEAEIARLTSKRSLVCMTFDPSGSMVAAGTSEGEILIWKNVGEKSENAESVTRYHWHAQAVSFLSFTVDGTYLISGGMEMVVVLWHVETGTKQFIPRLGFPLLHIAASPDPAIFSISSADNTIKYINIGTRKLEHVLHGIKPFVRSPRSTVLNTTKVVLEPQHGRLALPTVSGTLQFYDACHDRQAAEVVVAPMTYDPNIKDSRALPVLEEVFTQRILVTHVAFSFDASVMVTVDYRAGEEDIGASSFLRFWSRSSGNSPYSLHTRVDEPHKGLILGLAFHPSENLAVTCAESQDFKIWVQTGAKGGNYRWKCSSTGSYMRKTMRAVSFSQDGSMLAVSADEMITLWNPKSNGLLCVLAQCPRTKEVVEMVAFDRSNQYLVAVYASDRPMLTVWSLTTLSMCWAYNVEVTALAVDTDGPCFAILASSSTEKNTQDAYVCLFNPETPVPVSVWRLPLGKGGSLQFVPRRYVSQNDNEEQSSKNSTLVVFNRDREYIAFDPYATSAEKAVHRIEGQISAQNPLSSFEAMYGALSDVDAKVQRQAVQVNGPRGKTPWLNLLSGPSHVLPPLTKVAAQVLDSLLQKNDTSQM